MRRKVTIKDVAKEAGVSATTVSYVLNQNEKQTISEETKERVLDAAKKLNYIPNYAARIMKNDESRCVGLVMNRSFKIERFSTVVAGIMDELEGRGYRVLLCAGMQQEGQYSGYLDDYFRHHLDGLIFICNNNCGPSENDRNVIVSNRIPIVVFDSLEQDVPYETVDFDYRQGTRSVLESMLRPDMKRLIYLRPYIDSPQERIREAVVREVMAAHPEIDFRVICETREIEICRRQEAKEERSGRYLRCYREFLEQYALEAFRALKPSDGILLSLGIWMPMIRDILEAYGIETRLGTLAQIQEEGWRKQDVVYGKYHNYQAGKTCAKILAEAIIRERTGEDQVSHTVMGIEARRTGE